MILLGVETGGRQGGAALFQDGRRLGVRRLSTERRRASELIAAVDGLFGELGRRPGEVDVIAVSVGPGSFTGLRIGVTFAKTFALATGAKVVAVPSMDVLAANAPATAAGNVAVVLDAKRGEVFSGLFQRRDGTRHKARPDRIGTPAELLAEAGRPLFLLGEGLRIHGAALTGPGIEQAGEELWNAEPEVVAQLGGALAAAGEFADADRLSPVYLRRPEAEEVWAKRYGETKP
jgi:tRNA threonylcarbamoyladenosine biosynthesis protein TsaB